MKILAVSPDPRLAHGSYFLIDIHGTAVAARGVVSHVGIDGPYRTGRLSVDLFEVVEVPEAVRLVYKEAQVEKMHELSKQMTSGSSKG